MSLARDFKSRLAGMFSPRPPNQPFTTLSPGLLQKYRNPIFLETGTFKGEGVQMALEAGFQKVITVEVNDEFFTACQKRFAKDPRVVIHHGDSLELLPEMIRSLDAPATFWLDGHGFALQPGSDGVHAVCPILEELAAIAAHPIKTHTILIDDRRMFGENGTVHHDITGQDLVRCWGVGEEEIFAALRAINPAYQISFADGYEPCAGDWRKDDIIVASVP